MTTKIPAPMRAAREWGVVPILGWTLLLVGVGVLIYGVVLTADNQNQFLMSKERCLRHGYPHVIYSGGDYCMKKGPMGEEIVKPVGEVDPNE